MQHKTSYDESTTMVRFNHASAGTQVHGDNHANQRAQTTGYGGVRNGNTVAYYLYGLGGERLMEFQETCNGTSCTSYTENQRWIYFAGRKMFSKTGSTLKAVTPNRLASEAKHFPYGETDGTPPSDTKDYFATYRRDGTGLDYAWNRYYSSTMGRFTTADPYEASAALTDPQTWNRYAYVANDPVNHYDPPGLRLWFITWRQCGYTYGDPYCHEREGFIYFPDGSPGGGGPGGAPPDSPGGPGSVGGGGGVAERFLNALKLGPRNFVEALQRINKVKIQLREKTLHETCYDNVLQPLGLSSNAKIDVYFAAIERANIVDGLSSNVRLPYLYMNSQNAALRLSSIPNVTISGAMTGRTTAMAALNNPRIFINSEVVNSPQMTDQRLQATLMHEVLHNVTGLTDPDLQRRLGISESADTSNITAKLMDNCGR